MSDHDDGRPPPRRRPSRPGPDPRRAVPRRAPHGHDGPSARRSTSARPAEPLRLGSPRRRLRVSLLVMGFVFSLLAGRLIQLQVLDGTAYAADGGDGPAQVIALPAQRGQILDSSGAPLAMTVAAYDVTADPRQVASAHGDPATMATRIVAALGPSSGVDAATLRRQLADTSAAYQLLASKVSPAAWNRLKALGLPGVYDWPDSKRVYVPGGIAANVVGFVNAKGTGAGGIEQQYDKVLSGKDGRITYRAAAGSEVPTTGINEQPPVSGSSVELTINRDIEWTAQQDIAQEVATAHAASGTVVVQNVHTGQLLAIATAPTFDPNHITPADTPNLANRALTDEYEPGSVGKLMTVSAAIQHGFVTPRQELVVPPCINRAHYCFKDDTAHGVEHLTVTGMLAYSSNIGAIMVADQFGSHRDQILYNTFTSFGMGKPTGLDFPGESAGDLPPPSQWNASQRYTLVFGQGYDLTAVQATSMLSTIANGGVRVAPSLVKGTVAPNGTFHAAAPPATSRVVSTSTAKQVADMMQAVVSDQGTAPQAAIPGYLVAGKTGTANKYDASCGCYSGYTASFAGFAPADKPQIAVYVVLQDPTNGHFGDLVAAPVFKKVMSFALQTLHVPPTGGSPRTFRSRGESANR